MFGVPVPFIYTSEYRWCRYTHIIQKNNNFESSSNVKFEGGNNNLPIADNGEFLIVPLFKIIYNNIKNIITVWFLSLYLQKNHQCT